MFNLTRYLSALAICHLAFMLLVTPLFSHAADLPSEINLTSEAWEDATNEDGTGLYWDIMRLVYEPAGITVKYHTTSYARSVSLVKQQKSDAWLGSYIDEEDGVIYPKWYFDADHVSALYKKMPSFQWQGKQSLTGKNVGWIKGYNYNEYIETTFRNKEFKSRKQAIALLTKGRLDFFLDAKDELEFEMEKGYVDKNNFEIKPFMKLKLYPAFANNKRGEQLQKVFDKRIPELVKSGEIKQLYDKWEWGTFPYSDQ